MKNWNVLASDKDIEETVKNLKTNGFNPVVVENIVEARTKVFETLPPKAEVLTASSQTLEEIKRQALSNALFASGGRKMGAARLLDVDYSTFKRMLDRYNL